MVTIYEDLDLTENYYMNRQSPGWIVAGLSNLHIQVVYLVVVALGWKVGSLYY